MIIIPFDGIVQPFYTGYHVGKAINVLLFLNDIPGLVKTVKFAQGFNA